jgi:hypothetical protein
MAICKLVDILYVAVPSRRVRGWLIRSHRESCARCQSRLVSRAEAAALFVRPGDAGEAGDLWRRIEPRVGRASTAPGRRVRRFQWEWAAGAATLLVVAAAGFWLLRGVGRGPVRPDFAGPADRFEINYVNVGGAPAQIFIYQPQGSDTVFVWVGKNP